LLVPIIQPGASRRHAKFVPGGTAKTFIQTKEPGDSRGNWHNPETDESIHQDESHPPPIPPHLDYKAPNGKWYRWFPDNRLEPST
jgi:hypothetical protein